MSLRLKFYHSCFGDNSYKSHEIYKDKKIVSQFHLTATIKELSTHRRSRLLSDSHAVCGFDNWKGVLTFVTELRLEVDI